MIMMMSASIPIQNLIAAIILIISISFCHGINSNGRCIRRESEALLELKRGLVDSNMLASWDGQSDCCSWYGVICDNFTGHVLELHLQDTYGFGKISESLLELKQLEYLSLSNNDFGGISIPKFFGFMSSLRFLNLSRAGFGGLIPHQLGNLSNLQYLNINSMWSPMYVDKLDWISGLSSLKFLDLSYVDLSKAFAWVETLGKLPSLEPLHLSKCILTQIPPVSNVSFSSLSILDLSGNSFDGLIIPGWISSLTSLAYLDLSRCDSSGPVPSLLQNLTSLRRLDLSSNQFNSSMPDWFGGFPHLELLNLGSNELRGKIPSSIGNLTSLNTLDLSDNDLFEGGIPMSFKSLCNLKSLSLLGTQLSQEVNELIEILSDCVSDKLESLDLSDSQFSGYLSNLLNKFKSLIHLDLARNLITGSLPISFGEMASLTSLDLSSNKLNGSIPMSFGDMASLTSLDLSSNKLKGSIPLSFGRLQNLETVHLSFNSLEGEVSEIHFENLSSLISFYASGNHLILRVTSDWVPPFQLVKELYLSSWDVGPDFPIWLRYLTHLVELGLSNSNISSTLPTWFHNFSSNLQSFNLSHNQMYGMIHNLSIQEADSSIDLSSNYFKGPLPYMSSTLAWINLSQNLFSGTLHNFLCNMMQKNIGVIVLILKENLLHGEMPVDCLMSWTSLVVVELSNNNFSGNIPTSIGSLTKLAMLSLRNNNFTGDLPSTLQNCTDLIILDLGKNELRGEIPGWIGEHLRSLMVLNFRGNKFLGHMSKELCNLTNLQILDIADNNLTGPIPTCVGNLKGMYRIITSAYSPFTYINDRNEVYLYTGSSSIVRKGKMNEYNNILTLVESLDLSNNNFVGDIPNEITSLIGLQSLNLSYNFLTGRIPEDIGALTRLESLDLSQNRLFGQIPQSMSSMSFLSSSNLSNNNLSGQIPSSTQLQSLDASSFIGNNLYGPPLTNGCKTNGATEGSRGHSNETEAVDWFYFYVSLAPGFVVGFWCVVGPLVFNKRWRISYFNFLELLWDKIWVWFHLHVVRFVRSHGV